MALVVPCPNCATRLAAPDSAVGQRLRCPRCGALATVPDLIPAEEVPVIEAKIVPPPPKPKPVQAEAADDEDERPRKKRSRYHDDDYDRPRKRARRASGGGGGGNGGLIAGLAIGGLLLLAAIGFAVYFFVGKGSSSVKRSPVPAGWEQHTYPEDGFKVYLPKGVSYTAVPTDGWRPGGGRPARFGPDGVDWSDELPPVERFALLTANDPGASVHIDLYVIKFRDRVPSSVRGQIRRGADGVKLGNMEMRKTTWLGYDAVEQSHPGGVARIVYTDRHGIVASISGAKGTRARPEEEAGFFDNFELTD